MKKRMAIMLIGLAVLFGGIVAYKSFGNYMLKRYLASQERIATVSTLKAERAPWQPHQQYYASLTPVQGVNVTTDIAGLVSKIYFQSGATVKKGELLVQLKADSDIALLHSLEANTALAKITLDRDTAQYAIQAISKATLDADQANYKSLKAQTDQQAAIVNKKTIRAPFAGRLGISVINEGLYINVGDTIVPLQDLEKIYADFYVPQQELNHIKAGQSVKMSVDAYPNRVFTGTITAINPVTDTSTRNIKVQATIPNANYELLPGLFASIQIETGTSQSKITLPQTAVSFNSYGDVVFSISADGKDKQGKPVFVVKQHFVTTGETRGDQVAILKGIEEGDQVVISGQLKIKNGSRVYVNNTVIPTNNPAPKITEE